MVTALLVVGMLSPALAEAMRPHNPQIAEQLRDLKRTAFDARMEAESLKSMTPYKGLTWQSHSYRLEALKSHVNEMGKSLAELEAQKATATDGQALAIEQARLHLVPFADSLTQAIGLVNENRRNVHWGEYAEAVNDTYAHADALHANSIRSLTTRTPDCVSIVSSFNQRLREVR
jgi:hypothetical protein